MIPLISNASAFLLLGMGACLGALWGFWCGYRTTRDYLDPVIVRLAKEKEYVEQENIDLRDLVDTLGGGK